MSVNLSFHFGSVKNDHKESNNASIKQSPFASFFFKCILLTHSHTMTPLTPLGNKPFENTVGKGEIARNKQFLLFPHCFLPVWITFCHFLQI